MSGAWVRGECRLSTGAKVVLKYTPSLCQPPDIPAEATYPPLRLYSIHPSVIFPSVDSPSCPYLAKDKPVNLETPCKVRHHEISLVHFFPQTVETTEAEKETEGVRPRLSIQEAPASISQVRAAPLAPTATLPVDVLPHSRPYRIWKNAPTQIVK